VATVKAHITHISRYRSRRPRGAVVLVLSLAGPLGSGVHAAKTVTLAAMHLAVAAVLIPMMRCSARR
jgi:hypothetical protein